MSEKKQYIGTVDYIRELPRNMTAKKWIQIQKISNSLKYGKQEHINNHKKEVAKEMDTFGRYIAKYAPQYDNDKKLIRYRKILIKILEKYWDTLNPLYKHQHTRICRMAQKDYPDMIFKR